MMFWLDWKLFGNGWGMASPFCDDVFYWLRGHWYQWIGGFGAQLQSIEWLTPKPGTTRTLLGQEFRVFSANRRGPRVRVSWALAQSSEVTAERLRELHSRLKDWGHGKP